MSMNAIMRTTLNFRRVKSLLTNSRSFLKVGDKIPLNYIKDEPDIVVKEDKEYPDWVFKLTNKVKFIPLYYIY